jgi:hypothetical protein
MDRMMGDFAMHINAKKNQGDVSGKGGVVAIGQHHHQRGPVERVDSFKYVGGILVANNSLEAEVNAHKGRAVGAFV